MTAQEIVNKAKELFGTTTGLSKVSYINIDGTLLDFSGGHYKRLFDHRDIQDVFYELELDIDSQYPDIKSPYGDSTQGMFAYMNLGNIRFMPESNCFNFASTIEPTDAQYEALYNVLCRLPNDYTNIEFTDVRVDKQIAYKDYEPFEPKKVIDDIRYFYKNDRLPRESTLSQFRESKSK